MSDITYSMGVSCWHVVGYEDGDLARPGTLCGRALNGVGGTANDVVCSDMRVCLVCDRATGWQAGLAVTEQGIAENVRLGYMEVAGVDEDGEVLYRLTPEGEARIEAMGTTS